MTHCNSLYQGTSFPEEPHFPACHTRRCLQEEISKRAFVCDPILTKLTYTTNIKLPYDSTDRITDNLNLQSECSSHLEHVIYVALYDEKIIWGYKICNILLEIGPYRTCFSWVTLEQKSHFRHNLHHFVHSETLLSSLEVTDIYQNTVQIQILKLQ